MSESPTVVGHSETALSLGRASASSGVIKLMKLVTTPVAPAVRFLWLDVGLAASVVVLLAIGYETLWFILAFVGVLVSALQLQRREFVLRASVVGTAGPGSLVWAVAEGRVPPDELWEIPGFGLALVVVYGYAAQRERIQRELHGARARMVQAVSHDMKNPLTAVAGFASLMADSRHASDDPGEMVEFARAIADATDEALALVEDLSTSARLEAGTLSITTSFVELIELARSVALKWIQTSSDAHFQAPADEVLVEADELRVRQILRNLITNAKRYGGPNLQVRIGKSQAAGWIQVIDDGPGIPEDQQANIFKPYKQGGESLKPPDSQGLGLATSRELARRMGGDLHHERQAHTTVFQVTLPLASHA